MASRSFGGLAEEPIISSFHWSMADGMRQCHTFIAHHGKPCLAPHAPPHSLRSAPSDWLLRDAESHQTADLLAFRR